jgi:hypothetical protein
MLDAEGHWDDLQPKPVAGGGYEAFRRESLLREPQGSILLPWATTITALSAHFREADANAWNFGHGAHAS